MEEVLGIACFVVPTALFLILGLVVGGSVERSHFRSLEMREQRTSDMLTSQIKSFPAAGNSKQPPKLIVAECVIATDYLKSFLAGLRNIFGGEVRSYETLLVRARREATLRILEEARQNGYNAICNLRLETADIGGSVTQQRRGGTVMAAILASATAYHAAIPALTPSKPQDIKVVA